MKKLFFILTFCIFLGLGNFVSVAAETDVCATLKAEPEIEFTTSYGKLKYDFGYNQQGLTRLGQQYGIVEQGLFASGLAVVGVNWEVSLNTISRVVNDTDICVVPTSLNVFIGYQDPTIFISNQLQPRLAAFEKELEQQLKLIQISSELEIIRQDEIQYRGDLFSKETEEISDSQKHSIFEDYGYDIIHGFEEKLRDILTASKVGGAATARLNMENFDIEIGGFKKSVSMGGGFCGILNTITTLAMSAYLIDLDRPAPGFYAVDSSLTQLSEAEHKAQSETIKQNFVEYLIAHARERQVIIVEQSKRMPFVPSESEKDGVHVIQFSRNRQEGRYGFLNEVYNPEDR